MEHFRLVNCFPGGQNFANMKQTEAHNALHNQTACNKSSTKAKDALGKLRTQSTSVIWGGVIVELDRNQTVCS